MSAPTVCVPGQRLCQVDDHSIPGHGTYKHNGFIYSSLAGYQHHQRDEENKTVVEVQIDTREAVVPSVDATVTAQVTSVNPRFCKCFILCVGKILLKEPFRGLIRREDVRATEKHKVEMSKCFKPGDIILARILSLGDAHSYVMTTAENSLGVVIATSEAGSPLVPVSWCEMQCRKTLLRESRKVAKVQPEFTETSTPMLNT